METQNNFEQFLRKSNLSENTITSYLWTVDYFNANYEIINKENLLAYKGYLLEFFKPKTVNLRIQAINKYLVFLKKDRLQLKSVKIQQKNFLENVISNADYKFLKNQLNNEILDTLISNMNLSQGQLDTLNCYMAGMTFNEIAELLAVNLSTVWRRRQQLQQKYVAVYGG